ncbi:phosphatase PAP2 family protein [[Pseudomonas] carboxydohydrogena]|uniref:Phosphatase PAP2 family protein n=1 Tax=Afipia carboxydohydrogena TaxID=290 RepID=A0ABY8BQ94_AFICR|nr:phosphatase PAP2 family protein [[Pseudomonas] carboxydohydrogena]WEF51141.1 phosphatase PAP2 family protein [[Pseudomonas] carboxydohydrogena]
MDVFQPSLQRLNRAIWIVVAAMGASIVIASLIGPFHIEWASFTTATGACILLCAANWFYTSVRRDPNIGGALMSTAQIVAFTAVGAPLSYVAASAGFPLQDALLASWDRHLGIDWSGYVSLITSHAWLSRIFALAYASFTLQVITTVLILGFAGHIRRLNVFVQAFMLTTLLTIGISAVLPAMGPWLFYHAQPAIAHGAVPASSTSWPVFLGLRDGTFHAMSGLNSEGIITFPSLHAALGVLFVLALWRVRGLRWISLAINMMMIMATPFAGSHYVVDVIAGIAIAFACWLIAHRIVRNDLANDMTRLPPVADSPSIVPPIESNGTGAIVTDGLAPTRVSPGTATVRRPDIAKT